MSDRKTVMSWLEGLARDDWRIWYSDSEVKNTAEAAFELLKEQEGQIEQLEHDLAVAQDNLHYYVNGND